MVSTQLEKAFKKAIIKFRENEHNEILTDSIKLDVYKYYKQSTNGNCNIPKPSYLNIKEYKKWTAWNSILGMSQEESVEKYIALSFIF